MRITVTDKAIEQLRKSGLEEYHFLRLGVKPGGCAGMSYTANFDTNLTDQDKIIFEQEELKVVADTDVLLMLDGLNLDFSDDLIQPGFILKNPNAQHSCGCGASFKIDDVSPCPSCGGCG